MGGKPAFDKSSDSASAFAKATADKCATPDKSAGKFWFGRREKTRSWSKNGLFPLFHRPHYFTIGREVIHPYKYMRIYLWSALRIMELRIMVVRMRGLNKRDLIADFGL